MTKVVALFVTTTLFHCLHLISPTSGALVFNVGLPRTGTTSVHKAIPLLNFSSNHVAFNHSRNDIEYAMRHTLSEFRETGGGLLKDLFDSFDVFSDTPCYGIIPEIQKYYPDAKVRVWS